MKTNFLIVFLISASLLFSVDTINIASGEWPPYLGENLYNEGFASDVIREAFKVRGIEVLFGYFPWKRSFIYAEHGYSNSMVWNATAVWVYTAERSMKFNYSDVVIEDNVVIYSLKSNYINWETLDELNGYKFGGTLHTNYPYLQKAHDEGLLLLDRYGNYDTLFLRLLHRKLDGVPYDKKVAEYFLRNNLSKSDQNKITHSTAILQKRQYHLIFSKNIKENNRLLDEFNKGLAEIKNNGTYQSLVKRLDEGLYDKPVK